MRESVIERHLKRVVRLAGGRTKKLKGINDPDQLVLWPYRDASAQFFETRPAAADFVECKAPGKKARPGQAREHVRLQKMGFCVLVLDTIEKVDRYVIERKG